MDEGKIHVSQALLPVITDSCPTCGLPIAEPSASVEARLASVEAKLSHILGVMERTETVISKVAGEVMPTIEALASNPMIKALGFKSKGK